MSTNYPIGIIDVRHNPDHITLKKIQLFQEYGNNPNIARLFFILITRRGIEYTSNGKKLKELKVI